jgi:hypothetical protein
LGGLLRLVRSRRQALAEEMAPESMSRSELVVSFARSLAELPPLAGDPADFHSAHFHPIATALGVKLSPGPPHLWPSEAAALLRDAGLGEFSEDSLRLVERSTAYAEFCAEFDVSLRPSPDDELACAQHLYCMRELLIEAGNAAR